MQIEIIIIGNANILLKQKSSNYQYLGIDIVEDLINEAKNIYKNENNINFILDDLKSFCSKDSITYKMLFVDRKFMRTTISATYIFEEEYAFVSEISKEQIENTHPN